MLSYPYGWITAAVLFILSILLLILLSPVVFHGQIRRIGDDDNIELQVKALYGFVRYQMIIPTLEISGRVLQLHEQVKGSSAGKSSEKEKDEEIDADRIKRTIDILKQIAHLINNLPSWLVQTLDKVKLKEWTWSTTVGTGDAMWTAMVTGMFWSVKTSILGVVSQIVHLKTEPRMSVQPNYQQACFTTEWSCIAQIRLGYALLAAIHLLVRMKKGKGNIRAWQNILSKA